jgi:hypothetical protein
MFLTFLVKLTFLAIRTRRFPSMDIRTLRDRIERLDPGVHRALREALAAEYKRRTGEDCLGVPGTDDAPDPFEEAFRESARDLGERYVAGTSDYIRVHDPDLYRRTEDADRRMNEVWAEGRQGRTAIEEFQRVLAEWHSLHLRQIESYARAQAAKQSKG